MREIPKMLERVAQAFDLLLSSLSPMRPLMLTPLLLRRQATLVPRSASPAPGSSA